MDKLTLIKEKLKAIITSELGVDPIYPILFTNKYGIDRRVAVLAHVIGVDKQDLIDVLPKRTEGEGLKSHESINILVEMIREAKGMPPKSAATDTPSVVPTTTEASE